MEQQTEIAKLTKAINRQNEQHAWDQVIIRGCVLGIFQAVGATLGFAIFIIIASAIIRTAGEVPVLSDILRETKLDQLIENQLKILERQEDQNNVSPTPTVTPSTTIKPTTTVSPSPIVSPSVS